VYGHNDDEESLFFLSSIREMQERKENKRKIIELREVIRTRNN
jgi:hypothetical protein